LELSKNIIKKEKDISFMQGYGCAVATLVRGWNQTTLAKMIMQEGNLLLKDFEECCEDFDLKVIRKAFKEG